MDLVDKEDIAFVEVGQEGGEVAGLFDGGAGGGADLDVHLGGDDAGQSGFPEAGRAVEQDMVERFAAAAGGLDEDREVILDFFLADVVVHGTGAQRAFVFIGAGIGGGHKAFFFHDDYPLYRSWSERRMRSSSGREESSEETARRASPRG